MPGPICTDAELLEIARDLLMKGSLTVRNLAAAAGGGDYKRLGAVARRAREERHQLDPSVQQVGVDLGDAVPDARGIILPQRLATALGQLARAAAEVLHQTRIEEGNRARATEEALRAQHQESIRDLREQLAGVEAERDEVADLATEREAEVRRARGELRDARDLVAALQRQILDLNGDVREREDDARRTRADRQSERELLQAKIDHMQRRLDQANAAREAAVVACRQAEATARGMERALNEERQRRTAADASAASLSALVPKLEAERDALKSEYDEVRETTERLRRELAEARQESVAPAPREIQGGRSRRGDNNDQVWG